MLYPKTNVCKLEMTSYWAYLHVFKIAAKIIPNLTLLLIRCLMYLGIFVGVMCWSLFYNASLCVLSIFVNTLTRKRMKVALL